MKSIIGRFVTAKLKEKDDCRQGYVISVKPLRIKGESGTTYECEGTPTIVTSTLPWTPQYKPLSDLL